jgi:hypothetical protein
MYHGWYISIQAKNWGYLTRPNLELAILIISGCCKKMVYQYVVVAKRSKQSQPITGFEHGAFTDVFICYRRSHLSECEIDTYFLLKTLQMGEVGKFF